MRFLVQVITSEVIIAELLYFDREPYFNPDDIHEADEPIPLVDAFVLTGLCSSKGEARRLIAQGGTYVQNQRCSTDEEFWQASMIQGRYLLLRKGRKSIAMLEVIPIRVTLEIPEDHPWWTMQTGPDCPSCGVNHYNTAVNLELEGDDPEGDETDRCPEEFAFAIEVRKI